MQQENYPDPFELADWDIASAERVFDTLVHARDWKAVTGEAAPRRPPTAKTYAKAGLPWFEFYGKDQAALPGGRRLQGVKSVATLFKKTMGTVLPDSQDIEVGTPTPLGPGAKGSRPIRTSSSWDRC
jgi:hypothetical protein